MIERPLKEILRILRLMALAIGATLLPFTVSADVPNIEIICHTQSPEAASRRPTLSADGGWYRWRRDQHLSGRSDLVGWFSCPEVLWNIELSERGQWLELQPGEGETIVPLEHTGYIGDPDGIGPRFDLDLAHIDLDGVGWAHFPLYSGGYQYGDFLPGIAGPELITCDPGMAGADYNGEQDVPCYLMRREGNQWVVHWQSESLTLMSANMSGATPVVGDIDADGELEVAVSTWYYVYVLDLATGALESSATFIDPDDGLHGGGRPYGWMGAFNIDGDPALEIVLMADFMPFISVLDFNAQGHLVEAWDWQIETTAGINQKINRVTANAVADVTGDGVPDLVANVFNGNGDDRWHLFVFEAISGEVLYDIVDHHAEGVWDLDGDGTAEILATTTAGRLIHENGPAILMSLAGGSRTDIFQSANESWHWSNLADLPDHVNSQAALSLYHPAVLQGLAGSEAVVVTERSLGAENNKLTLYALESGSLIPLGTVTGPNLQVYGADENLGAGTVAVQASFQANAPGEIQLSGFSMTRSGARDLRRGDGQRGMFRSLLRGTIVLPREGAPPLMVSEGSGDNIKAFQVDAPGTPPVLQWRKPGHGMSSGLSGVSKNGLASIQALTPDPGGEAHVAVVRQGADSGAEIAVLRPDGSTRWARSLQTQSEPPLWNNGGVTHWVSGRFNAPDREDLYVVIRRSTMLDDTGFMLDGRTGEILWSKENGAWYNWCAWNGPNDGHRGGPTAFQAAVADWDGDGLDDVFDHSNATLAVYRGTNGEVLINRWSAGWCGEDPALLFDPTLFSNQVVGSIVDQGPGTEPSILFSMNPVTLASMQFDGTVNWKTPDGSGFSEDSLAVAADLNGDGALEVVTVDHCGTPGAEIRAYDLANGQLRWTLEDGGMCFGNGAHSPVAADLDGDGRDEVLAVSGSRLITFAEDAGGNGVLRWEAVIGNDPDSWQQELGTPVIADVTGTGNPVVLINTASGQLFALGTNADAPLKAFTINAGISDAWVTDQAPFQGMFITVFPVLKLVFVAWFTFDSQVPSGPDEAVFGAGDQRWVTGLGSINANRVDLSMELTSGGGFNSSIPTPIQQPGYGTMSIEFEDCAKGQVTYDFPDAGLAGSIEISRVLGSNVPLCEALEVQQ